VYDFAASPADVPNDAWLSDQYADHTTPQTPEEIASGKKLGADMASQLIDDIGGMGLPAEKAVAGTVPQINDLVLRGYLISIKEGSTAKRVAIGFGSGASELRTAVEGYHMTAQGLSRIGAGTVDSGGSKTPGAALGLAAFIATANPAGLIVSTGMKVYGEASGSSKVEGRDKQTIKEISEILKKRFQEQGWIQ
jgi:hypothetical protein